MDGGDRLISVRLKDEVLLRSFLFGEFGGRFLGIRKRCTCPRKGNVGGWRWGSVFFRCLIVEADGQASSGVFFPQLLGYLAGIQLLHELLVFWNFVVLEFAVIDLESVLIESDSADVAVFLFLLFGEILVRPE